MVLSPLILGPLVSYLFFFPIFVLGLFRADFSVFDAAWGVSGSVVLTAAASICQTAVVGGSQQHQQERQMASSASAERTTMLAIYNLRFMIAFVFVICWSLRLSLHLFVRWWQSGPDWRYQTLQRSFRSLAVDGFTKVYLVQATAMWIQLLPLLDLLRRGSDNWNTGTQAWDLAGIVLAIVGLFFETVADADLEAFRNRSNGRTPQDRPNQRLLTTGIWSLCRHPNYFGEMLFWWGLFILAGAFGGDAAHRAPWWTAAGPLLLTMLLRFVSGVPLLERKFTRTRGPEWQAYAGRTPCLIPFAKWLPFNG